MKRTLFICAYGQSRSRYFAEELQKKGQIALFCGYNQKSMIKINMQLINWSQQIVILDSHFQHDDMHPFAVEKSINFFMDDNPEYFEDKKKELFELLNIV